jgi:LysM repeat protein
MVKRVPYITALVTVLFLYGCGVKRPAVQPEPSASSGLANDYVNRYRDIAVSEMKRSGIPASITLAQGMIESDFGRSSLARNANNHFGIKCHNGWTGPSVTHHDDRKNECFRKYNRVEDSFYDHSEFLRNGSRYRELFDYSSTDYKAWARGLKKAGYATNPSYDNMLIKSIEENGLWYYDRGYKPAEAVAAKENGDSIRKETLPLKNSNQGQVTAGSSAAVFAVAPRVVENNRIQYIIVKDGETREKLEKEFNLLRWELPRYNELEENFKPYPGQILYLQPKRDKAEAGIDYHTVMEGETLHSISQKYGIKVKSLSERNMIVGNIEPAPGTRLKLR